MTPDASSAPAPADSTVGVRLRGLAKDYGPVRVVAGMDLDLHRGQIHALLGENGAGKSTLIKMLAGVVSISDGTIEIDGTVVRPQSVKDAQRLGIVALPQELTLVPGLDAADNIFLGLSQPTRGGAIRRRELRAAAAHRLARLGQSVPLHVPVGELSAVQQTMVALARALAREATVLILDEPTAALTDTETEQLFAVLRRLRAEGAVIVYVSHRLEEVFALADVATVMRNGRKVWTKPIEQTSQDEVVAAMIGRSPGQLYPPRVETGGDPVIEIRDLTGHTVRGVSLTAVAGRVLGVAGLAGAGRSELLRIVAGAEKPVAGTIVMDGRPVPRGSVKAAMKAGIALVPEERRTQGLILSASITDNIALPNLASLSRFGIASRRRETEVAARHRREFAIRSQSERQFVGELSGGNQQKVVLAKYLETRPRVLLLDEPTRGIDVGTKAEIYSLIRHLAAEGVAIVMVSSEIPELIGVSDDIAVLHEGRLIDVLDAATTTETILLQRCYARLT